MIALLYPKITTHHWHSSRCLKKPLENDSGLKNIYTETIKEDLDKGYVIPVEPHDAQLRSAL